MWCMCAAHSSTTEHFARFSFLYYSIDDDYFVVRSLARARLFLDNSMIYVCREATDKFVCTLPKANACYADVLERRAFCLSYTQFSLF